MGVPVHDVLLVFAVVVDGCRVRTLVSGGLIFTLPVMLQLTMPVALPRATLPAKAVPENAAMPPRARAAAVAAIPILRIMLSSPICVRTVLYGRTVTEHHAWKQ